MAQYHKKIILPIKNSNTGNMETFPFVFQTDSKEVNNIYKNNTNYLIEYSDRNNLNEQNKYCTLYFSSNDIYYPNNAETIYNELVIKNKFEWYGTRIQKAHKHIFLRDIKKQWYLTGINHELNTIEKLLYFLKQETSGYKIITLGSSAGGFAAVLLGQLLGAEYSLTFNGQFNLTTLLNQSKPEIDPVIFRERNNKLANKYYELNHFIKDPDKVFYFHSNKSSWDLEQINFIKDIPLHVISFNTSHHGIPFLKSNLPYVINLPIQVLKKYTSNNLHPLVFSIKIEGFKSTGYNFIKQGVGYLKRKYRLQ